MRVSVDPRDPGYAEYKKHPHSSISVSVDGVEVRGICITADEEQGYAVVYERDADGNFVLNEARDEVCVVTLRGKVVIKTGVPKP